MKTIKTFYEYHIMNESLNMSNINSMIDYTELNENAGEDLILEACQKADQLGTKSVCVLPKMVSTAADALADSEVLVCTVVSFPHGTDDPGDKLAECQQCIADGADEIDMVLNYPLLKRVHEGIDDADLYGELVDEVSALVEECHKHMNKAGTPVILKVIVESGLLDDSETAEATQICLEAGADFIKTSTGKVSVGAEVGKVQIMRHFIEQAGSSMQIKASGGIRTTADVQQFLPYVDRLGIGWAAVDKMNGIGGETKSNY